jgi:hypothetical protein
MSSQEAWPPPPVEPDEPFDDDALLKSLVLGSRPWSILTRSTLARQLRRVTKEDRRTSVTVVNDFCDRFQIFPRDWIMDILWPFFICFFTAAIAGCMYLMDREIDVAATKAAAFHIFAQFKVLVSILFALDYAGQAAMLYFFNKRYRRALRDAVEKLSS